MPEPPPTAIPPILAMPSTVAEAATLLAECARTGQAVRPAGAGTRSGWGGVDQEPVLDVSSRGLGRVLEHNPGDFTALFEAGVPLARAQAALAGSGQWLAIDPAGESGTIGGLVATADSGPARHRFGGMRDLVIGITVVLSDGTVASSGGRVIKNVAGYDLGKLFTGSYGTLGLIASVGVRLHPVPPRTVTLTGATGDPARLARVAAELARRPLEALCLDAWWRGDTGGLLVRFGGVAAADQAGRTRPLLGGLDAVSIVDDDGELWAGQRRRQRSTHGAVVKVSGRPTDLPAVVAAARAADATVVSRAALGLSWLALAPGDDLAARVDAARASLAPRACMVLDRAGLDRAGQDRASLDRAGLGGAGRPPEWPAEWPAEPGALAVMRRVKARFDPARIFRPGIGGI